MPATQTTYSLGTLLLLSGVALPRPEGRTVTIRGSFNATASR
jgi:hypothetical protein